MGLPPLAALAAGLGVLAAPLSALADPCTAPLPARGTVFSGQVRHIIDGDGLCVGRGGDPSTWIEVRLADFYAPELSEPGGEAAKTALAHAALGRWADCRARGRSYDRVVAVCRVGGAPLGEILRRAGVRQGGRGR